MIRRSRIPALILAVVVMSLPIIVGLAIEDFREAAVLLFFGSVVTALATLAAMRGISQRKWPTTSGRITESKIVPGRRLFGWQDPETDRLIVHYSYTVEDQTFDRTLDVYADSDIVSNAFGGYPKKDGTVRIYYNPRRPSEGVLAPGPGCLALCFFVLGIAGVGLGCYLIWR